MRSRLLPGVAALSLALTACGGGDGDEPAPSLGPLESTSTPSPTAAAVPSEAAAATPEGAAEFVRYFYEQLETAYAERDPELVRPLVAPECKSCERYLKGVTRLRDENARVENYELEVVEAVAPGGDASSGVSVLTVVNLGEFVRYDAQGQETTRTPAVPRAVQTIDLIREGDRWLVREVTAE